MTVGDPALNNSDRSSTVGSGIFSTAFSPSISIGDPATLRSSDGAALGSAASGLLNARLKSSTLDGAVASLCTVAPDTSGRGLAGSNSSNAKPGSPSCTGAGPVCVVLR